MNPGASDVAMLPDVVNHVHENQEAPPNRRLAGLKNLCQVLGIHEEAQDTLEYSCYYHVVQRGGVIFNAGAYLTHIYFVVSGTAKTKIEHEGELYISDFAVTGDIIGLEGMDNLTYATTAVAVSNVVLLCVPHPTFISYSQKFFQVNSAIMRKIGERIARTTMFLEVMARASAETKVAFFLAYLSVKAGDESGPAKQINLGISRGEIASHLGLAYETTVRILSNFKSTRIIVMKGQIIIINNPTRLHDLCGAYIKRLLPPK